MNDRIVIIGAGLVGSLLAKMLAKKGFPVSVYEKRPDPRKTRKTEGRSINLALSHRGIRALKSAEVFDKIKTGLIPMHGRKMHDSSGELTEQSYGKEGQFINSVSRGELNLVLVEEAEASGVDFHFDHECIDVDFESSTIKFKNELNETSVNGSPIFGTDGAFSAVRSCYERLNGFNQDLKSIEHGYKELRMPPKEGEFAMEPNFLHIWPRGNFMLIALPNRDKSFTCTLFLPFEGDTSFGSLKKESSVLDFFEKTFPDVQPLISDLVDQFLSNPTSSLVTLKCYPWVQNETMLLGDSSHAIVPFYGQGMNSGFEDCRLLMELAESRSFQWNDVLKEFQEGRKKDTDAIADLALKNFVEMRDWVGDESFLKRKKIEAMLHEKFPAEWIPQYSMVTFSDIPYSNALKLGDMQEAILAKFLHEEKSAEISSSDLGELVFKFNQYKGSNQPPT